MKSDCTYFDLAPLIGSAIFGTLLFIADLIQCLLFITIKLSEKDLLDVHIGSHLFF